MTVLSVLIEDDSAHVVADMASEVQGLPRRVQKVFPLIHMPAIIAGRGPLAFILATVVSAVCDPKSIPTFEALLKALPGNLRNSWRQFPSPAESDDVSALEVVAVGPVDGRLCGTLFQERHQFEPQPIELFLAPMLPDFDPDAFPENLSDMVALGQRQQLLMAEQRPDAANGGPLVAVTLSAAGMSSRIVEPPAA